MGPYRRRQSIWLIDTDKGEIVLDDYEVIDLLAQVIASDDALRRAWDRMACCASESDADVDTAQQAFAA